MLPVERLAEEIAVVIVEYIRVVREEGPMDTEPTINTKQCTQTSLYYQGFVGHGGAKA